MMFKGLSGNALKVIAIVAMTIDHLAWVGIETYEQAEIPCGRNTSQIYRNFPKQQRKRWKSFVAGYLMS